MFSLERTLAMKNISSFYENYFLYESHYIFLRLYFIIQYNFLHFRPPYWIRYFFSIFSRRIVPSNWQGPKVGEKCDQQKYKYNYSRLNRGGGSCNEKTKETRIIVNICCEGRIKCISNFAYWRHSLLKSIHRVSKCTVNE